MVGTTFAGVDLFAHEATFAGLLPKLARSYALDAMELNPKTPFKPPKASAQRLVADVVSGASEGVSSGWRWARTCASRAGRSPVGRWWRAAPCCTWRRSAATRNAGPARVRRIPPGQPAARGTACGGSDGRACRVRAVSAGRQSTACRKPPRPGKVALSPRSWLIHAIGFSAIAGVVAGHHRRWTP